VTSVPPPTGLSTRSGPSSTASRLTNPTSPPPSGVAHLDPERFARGDRGAPGASVLGDVGQRIGDDEGGIGARRRRRGGPYASIRRPVCPSRNRPSVAAALPNRGGVQGFGVEAGPGSWFGAVRFAASRSGVGAGDHRGLVGRRREVRGARACRAQRRPARGGLPEHGGRAWARRVRAWPGRLTRRAIRQPVSPIGRSDLAVAGAVRKRRLGACPGISPLPSPGVSNGRSNQEEDACSRPSSSASTATRAAATR
jgi:hypothetical protein